MYKLGFNWPITTYEGINTIRYHAVCAYVVCTCVCGREQRSWYLPSIHTHVHTLCTYGNTWSSWIMHSCMYIRLLIGRYAFGSEFGSETMVIIRNPNQCRKGLPAALVGRAFSRGLAISLISAISWNGRVLYKPQLRGPCQKATLLRESPLARELRDRKNLFG